MAIIFDIVFLVLGILYLPVLILSGKWHQGFRERLGFLSPEIVKALTGGSNIWVHAVSVGEVAAVEGLIKELKGYYPGKRIVLSVTTKT
ncbi:MAG: 3-deoxy-D-manno-octulosonic acid transferase, partial [Candidatus Omnitrophica bacterium]|nr:3-deoxy-D-manno-octulosonic acid transferase [Candidatus Omnitrophota bacterium]